MEIRYTTTIDAPVERVWALTLDIEGLPGITPTITSAERLDGSGAVVVGTTARLTQPGLPARVWTVETVEPPNRFTWSTRLLGIRMVGIHELEALDENRTGMTLAVVFEGPGAGLLARLGRRRLSKTLATEAAGFQRAAVSAAA